MKRNGGLSRPRPPCFPTMKILPSFAPVLAGLAMFAAGHAHASVLAYLDTATYTGYYQVGGATDANPTTNLIGDDLNFPAQFAGRTFDAAAVYVVNPTSDTFSARFGERFYAADGPNGGPGTLLSSLTLKFQLGSNAIILCGSQSPLPAANQFVLPADGKIWAAVFFDNLNSTATTAQLNSLGIGLFNPPQLGTSADRDFLGAGPGTYTTNNPAGVLRTTPYNGTGFVANYGWQISVADVVPEPSSLAFLAVGAAAASGALVRRHRRAATV